MRLFTLSLLAALLMVGGNAFAASVKSMSQYSEGRTDEGKAYIVYAVVCGGGVKVPITHWKEDKQWCLGEISAEQCRKKKAAIASKACKIR